MSLFDSILGQVSGNLDVKGLAEKVGLDPAMAEKALAALTAGHQAEGDTVSVAAAKSGLDAGKLQDMLGQLGGEGGLAGITAALGQNSDALKQATAFLDKDGDGNPLNDIAGMAKGLFGG
ncbi:MAG: hypothetical protein ACK4G2_07195 [Novosphingobium sp.]